MSHEDHNCCQKECKKGSQEVCEKGRYFTLDTDCICVHGAKRAAIYDLNTGDVFSIDPVSREIIDLLQDGKAIDEVAAVVTAVGADKIAEYLSQLEENHLGRFHAVFQAPQSPQFPTTPESTIRFIWLELRENCNLNCLHCYSGSTSQGVSSVERLDEEDWKRVILQAYNLGARALQFIGGEPFLYGAGLFDLAAYAREMGYTDIEIFSNLTLVKDEWLDLIEKYHIKIATSIYGPNAEVHDRITTRAGSFEQTMKVVEKIRERKIPVRYALTIMRQNQDHAEATMELFRQLGSAQPRFDLVRPCGRANDEELVPQGFAVYRERADFYQVDKEEFIRRYRGNSCWQGKLSVTSTGDIYPCIMQRDNSSGNVKTSSLEEIVTGKLQEYWSLSRDKLDICKDCEYRYLCRDCRPVSFGPTGELKAKDPTCLYDPYEGQFKPKQ